MFLMTSVFGLREGVVGTFVFSELERAMGVLL